MDGGFNAFAMYAKGLKRSDYVSENGFGDGSSASGSRSGVIMYKRRKRAMMSISETETLEDGKAVVDTACNVADKTMKELLDRDCDKSSSNQVSLARHDSYASLNRSDSSMNRSDECSLRNFRKLVLEHMSQSLHETEGGLQECIQNALKDSTFCGKESCYPSNGKLIYNPSQNIANGHAACVSNRYSNGLEDRTKTDLCKRAFFDILTSEKFTELCNLIFKNFGEVKVESILDVNLINTRMKEGAYEGSPMLFLSDIQQVWAKLQKIGSEIVALSKSFSDKSRSYCGQVAGLAYSTSEDGKHESLVEEAEMIHQPKQTDHGRIYKVFTCKHCRMKADVQNSLVCDSCEEMYHVTCIEPAIEEIPQSWYCADCISKGIESPHENCVLCDRLAKEASTSQTNGQDEIPSTEDEFEDNLADGFEGSMFRPSTAVCKKCKCEVKNGEKFRTCGHSFCESKFYHDHCLTNKELGIYGPFWYCPSCLCRVCLVDKDDDKIVMCDSCDHGYHIYCMVPPRNSVPKGKWFCGKCEKDIRLIKEAKKVYMTRQNNLKNKDVASNGEHDNPKEVELKADEQKKYGGVDMLLDAALKMH